MACSRGSLKARPLRAGPTKVTLFSSRASYQVNTPSLTSRSWPQKTAPPGTEPSMARHLNPSQGDLLAPPKPTLPSKMGRFSASIHQTSYMASVLAVRLSSLLTWGSNWRKGVPYPHSGRRSSLLMTSPCAMHVKPSTQAGVPWPSQWLASVHCGLTYWISLTVRSSASLERWWSPEQALFGPAIALMQQHCDNKKMGNEALKLCLPRKSMPHQAPAVRSPIPPGGCHFQNASRPKPQNNPPAQQGNPPSAKPWGRKSFAAATAKKTPSPAPSNAKRKQPA